MLHTDIMYSSAAMCKPAVKRVEWQHLKSAGCRCKEVTFIQTASWPVNASGRLMPFSAIQSISLSQRAQSHHA